MRFLNISGYSRIFKKIPDSSGNVNNITEFSDK